MIIEKLIEYKKSQIKQWPVRSNWASQLGHDCELYLVFLRTRWKEKVLHTIDLQIRFDEGRLHEEAILRDLQNAGLKIIEQQRPFDWPEYNISGHIDAKVLLNGKVIPLEIKSTSSFSFQSINSINDLLNGKYLYLRQYPAQLTLYLLMDNKEEGLFIFKNKESGQLKEIPMVLDYDYGEKLIQKAERINQHIKNGTQPDPIEWDENICGNCGFGHICLNEAKRQGLEIVTNPELEEKLERREELKLLVKEYNILDKEIKGALEGIEKQLIGNFLITGKWQERKAFTVEASKFWVPKISRIEGGMNNDARE